MRVTVTEFPDAPSAIAETWQRLAAYLETVPSDIVLLPELVATSAFWSAPSFDAASWRAAVAAGEAMEKQLGRSSSGCILGTRAVERGGHRYNEAFLWSRDGGFRPGRAKAWLPQEEGGWEATWFDRGDPVVAPQDHQGLRCAFLICTELFVSPARALGKAGTHLIAVPRATGGHDRWMVGTRNAAIVSGAFVVTANRRSADAALFAGGSWVVSPDGDLLCMTSAEEPFVTTTIDLAEAERAKQTYPRNVPD